MALDHFPIRVAKTVEPEKASGSEFTVSLVGGIPADSISIRPVGNLGPQELQELLEEFNQIIVAQDVRIKALEDATP